MEAYPLGRGLAAAKNVRKKGKTSDDSGAIQLDAVSAWLRDKK